ncbi:MAG: hypothetical protein JW891_04405 [Candidatus Lokiarchaeota archaeon]|nr:hypothetical protein [Candidatus Lokiarchaeota archaeon]
MITTREAINYQYSIIFGYISSKNDEITVGDVIGPGNLTREKIINLYHEVIKFLNTYNAILRDFTGSELFSIEFLLLNKDSVKKEKQERLGIFPKSMILLPGQYKESECLLLALKPELGILDVHSSKNSIDEISKLFSEVEEFIDRPDLENDQKNRLRQKFASRFSKKLYGELIEKKWDKKLIGLIGSEPTGKNYIHTYATNSSNITIKWHKKPREVILKNSRFKKQHMPLKNKIGIDYMRYLISEPSMNFILENTIKFGIDLFDLCDIGTLDEIQDKFVSYILSKIMQDIEPINKKKYISDVDSLLRQMLTKMNMYSNKFLQYSNEFLISGERGGLKDLKDKYWFYVKEKGKLEGIDFELLLEIAQTLINQSVNKKKELRASEFRSILNYLGEIFKKTYDNILNSLPNYLMRRRLAQFIQIYANNLKDNIKEPDLNINPLIDEYIELLKEILIEKSDSNFHYEIENPLEEHILIERLKDVVKQSIRPFINNLNLSPEKHIDLIKEKFEPSYSIGDYIDNFKKFPGQIRFLTSYITKYSSINRFLTEQMYSNIKDPVTFSSHFHRFLERRVGGIDLYWKEYILNWIQDYAKQFFKEKDNDKRDLCEIVEDFLDYIDIREETELKLEGFLKIISTSIEKISNAEKKAGLEIFYDLLKKNITHGKILFEKVINMVLETINVFEIKENPDFNLDIDSFYEYLKKSELMYYSQLLPLPSSIILKQKLSEQEKDLFSEDFYHVINFKYWHDRIKIYISNNFKTVYKEWVKES